MNKSQKNTVLNLIIVFLFFLQSCIISTDDMLVKHTVFQSFTRLSLVNFRPHLKRLASTGNEVGKHAVFQGFTTSSPVSFWPHLKRLASQDNELHINDVQIIGSHNSYKQALEPSLLRLIKERDSTWAAGLEYDHIPIPQQLDLGLRNLEIDVYGDSVGGRYSSPKGLMGKPATSFDPSGVMNKPGFKVFHIAEIDFRSSCLLFEDCLQQLRQWSDDHPDHTTVFITLEAKDRNRPSRIGFSLTPAEEFTRELFDKLDLTIIEGLGAEKLITPDRVRGKYQSLSKAVQNGNWPTLADGRGKFLFILDDQGRKKDLYMDGHPSLRDRVFFVNAEPGTDEAATLIINDPRDERIPDLVKRGYIVRTRADSNTTEARHNDYSTFQAACESGAQIITTDFYLKSNLFNSPYRVSFENGLFFRLNPSGR